MKKTIAMLAASAIALSATMPVFAADTFKDVSEEGSFGWAYEYVEDMAAKGLISGYEDGTFKPEKPVSRLEAFALFARLMGSNNEINEEVLEAATEKYKDVLKGYELSYAEGDVAFMMSRGVLAEDELDTYFEGNKKSEAMPRHEAAVLITKAMLAEEVATSEVLIDLEYTDTKDIPNSAKQYVYYVSEKGIINGMGDGTFAPNAGVRRSEVAVMMSKTISCVNYHFEAATLEDFDTDRNNVKITDYEEEIGYNENTKFLESCEAATEDDMEKGQRVVMTYSEDDTGVHLAFVDILVSEVDSSVLGIFRNYKSAGGELMITIEDPDTNKTAQYECRTSASVILNDESVNINALRSGDYVKLNISGGKVIEIIAMEKKQTVSNAKIKEIDPIGKIIISHDNPEYDNKEYAIASTVMIMKNGDTSEFSKLYEGDTVTLSLEYGVLTKIVAKSTVQTITGNLASYTVSASPSLTIKIDGKEHTYKIPSNVAVTNNGETVKLADLTIGGTVTLTIESDVVKSISVTQSTGTNAGDSITGVVTAVNPTANVIVVTTNASGVEESVYITCDKYTKYYVVPTLSEYSIKQIEIGDTIVAYGDRSTGIFICSGVTVSPAK